MVQTGPKSQFGGENEGLFKVVYQVGIEEAVKTLPRIPMSSQPIMERMSFGNFFTFIEYGIFWLRRQVMSEVFAEMLS